MIYQRTLTLLCTIIVAATCITPLDAQDKAKSHEDETVAKIPILSEFHDVIYQIWHTAWPEKNVAMLAELLPEVERYTDTLGKVALPGILRDKKDVWKRSVEELGSIAREYAKAASPVDTQKLMDAAERLHAQYEKLVRITRPVLKEVDAFHQVLYMLYHHYLPSKNQEKISFSVTELQEKMALLDAAKLPDRLKKREPAFLEARTLLSASVKALSGLSAEKDMKAFEAGVEKMHTDYQNLEKVFE